MFKPRRRKNAVIAPVERTFVYAVDGAGSDRLTIVAMTAQEALTGLRDLHGYRTLMNAQLIDVV